MDEFRLEFNQPLRGITPDNLQSFTRMKFAWAAELSNEPGDCDQMDGFQGVLR